MGTTTTAHDVAGALRGHLRTRIAYLPDRKLHALLYFAQGLTLGDEGRALFDEPVVATEAGVRVDYDSAGPARELDDAQFGVVAVTAGRYGGLSAMDLEALIRGQGPWSATDLGRPVDIALIRDTFRRQDDIPEGTLSGVPRTARAGTHPAPDPHLPFPEPDSAEEIAAFIADAKARR